MLPPKWGAQLYTHDGQGGRGVDFTSSREVRNARTFQVCREELDRILLERARRLGVDVREQRRISACEFDSQAATVAFAGPDGETGRVRVKAMVDATGGNGLLARKFDLRTPEPRLANVALYSHFSGVPLIEGDRPTDLRLISRDDAGWFWLIPISENLMSVGVVVPREIYMSWPHGDPAEILNRAIADTPVVAAMMRDARREWPVRVEKDFSYSASTYAGDRWLLAGDAGSFLDRSSRPVCRSRSNRGSKPPRRSMPPRAATASPPASSPPTRAARDGGSDSSAASSSVSARRSSAICSSRRIRRRGSSAPW
ncbi:MAG: tryptophan 7-halogenase [Thermoanaerobaculia bacterium]